MQSDSAEQSTPQRTRRPLTHELSAPRADPWQHVAPSWDRWAPDEWFMRPATVQQWCTLFGRDLGTRGVIWRAGVEPVGAALFSVRTVKRGPFPVRQAVVNLVPDYGFLPEHQRLLAAPGRLPEVAAGLLTLVRRTGCDELLLCGFDDASSQAVLDASGIDPAYAGYFSDSPYVDLMQLRNSGATFTESRSASLRAKIRRSIRAYESGFGDLTLDEATTPSARAEFREELVQLHQAAWQARNEPGAFSSASVLRFLDANETSHGTAAPLCWLRVRSGATTIAALLYAVHGPRVLFLQSGLRYDEGTHYRPGLVAHTMAIDWFAARGADEYDFLGGERVTPRYKTELSDRARRLGFLTIPLPTPRTWFVTAVRWLRDETRRRWGKLSARAGSV